MPQTCSRPCFIAVHVGAGYHAEAKEPEYASAMHAALRQAAIALQAGSTADVAVARAIMALEVRGVLHTSCTLGSACELGRALVTGTRGRVVPPLVALSHGAALPCDGGALPCSGRLCSLCTSGQRQRLA